MSSKTLTLAALLILSLTTAVKSGSNDIRFGVSFGGTQFVGFSIEKFYGDNSLRLNLGVFEIEEICISLSVNRYLTTSDLRPFVGIGLWDVVAITPKGLGSLTLLNIPVGLDWNANGKHFLGAELDLNFSLFCIDPEKGSKKLNRRFIPFPGIYYKYKF